MNPFSKTPAQRAQGLDGQALLGFKKWAVVGDVRNPDKWAHAIFMRLVEAGYTVYGVDPRARPTSEGPGASPLAVTSLKDLPEKVDVLDLVVNPAIGLKVLMEAHEQGIDKVLIQPGASSPEILEYCSANGIHAVQSCALVELEKRSRRG